MCWVPKSVEEKHREVSKLFSEEVEETVDVDMKANNEQFTVMDNEDFLLHEPKLETYEISTEYNTTSQKKLPQILDITVLYFVKESIFEKLLSGLDTYTNSSPYIISRSLHHS